MPKVFWSSGSTLDIISLYEFRLGLSLTGNLSIETIMNKPPPTPDQPLSTQLGENPDLWKRLLHVETAVRSTGRVLLLRAAAAVSFSGVVVQRKIDCYSLLL